MLHGMHAGSEWVTKYVSSKDKNDSPQLALAKQQL